MCEYIELLYKQQINDLSCLPPDQYSHRTFLVPVYNPEPFVLQLNHLFPVASSDGYRDVAELFESIITYVVCLPCHMFHSLFLRLSTERFRRSISYADAALIYGLL